MEQDHKDTFHEVANAVISEEKPVSFEQGLAALLLHVQIFVRNAITGILLHVEEAMAKFELGTLTA